MIVFHISFDYGKIIKNFYDEKLEVSSHFAVSRNGEYAQFVGLEDSSWANGTSLKTTSDVYYKFSASDIVKSRNINANYYTYSIEHESIDGSLTKEQYVTTLNLMCKIIDYIKCTYGVNFKIDEDHIVGHHDINPIVRVSCPNEKFPIKQLISDLKEIYKKRNNNIDYEILVNKDHVLPKDYFPGNLVLVENRKGDNPNAILLLEKTTASNFRKLQKAALNDGLDIICDSGFRSLEYQQKLIDKKKKLNESLQFIASVGASEHHTGLCMDIAGIVNGKYTDDNLDLQEIYQWLEHHAHKYGSIIRYPKGKESITGYPYEPWHIRYVGVKIATAIYENDLTYEEYCYRYKKF